MVEEHIVIGSDGKAVTQKIPRFVSETPWYAQDEEPTKKRPLEDTYEAKRDRYKHYDSEQYKKVVDNFKPAKELTGLKHDSNAQERIVDTYSRVVASASTRDFKDTAYYLTDLGEAEHDFEPVPEPKPEPAPQPPEPHQERHAQKLWGETAEQEPPAEETREAETLKEDIYPKNHTSIYGSFYSQGKWGFKCCGRTGPGSMCDQK